MLTRLPSRARRAPAQVLEIMRHNFPRSAFLSPQAAHDLSQRLVDLRVSGGSVSDALVGSAAAEHGVPLVSRDARTADLYRLLGAEVELLD